MMDFEADMRDLKVAKYFKERSGLRSDTEKIAIKALERAIKAEAEVERLNKMIDGLLLDLQMVATDESTEGYPCICSICAVNCNCPDEARNPYSNRDSLCKFVWRGAKREDTGGLKLEKLKFKTIKDIKRNTPEGELAYRTLLELWRWRENIKLNDLVKLIADETYCVPIPKKNDACYCCDKRS